MPKNFGMKISDIMPKKNRQENGKRYLRIDTKLLVWFSIFICRKMEKVISNYENVYITIFVLSRRFYFRRRRKKIINSVHFTVPDMDINSNEFIRIHSNSFEFDRTPHEFVWIWLRIRTNSYEIARIRSKSSFSQGSIFLAISPAFNKINCIFSCSIEIDRIRSNSFEFIF